MEAPQQFKCTIEVTTAQENGDDDIKKDVIRFAKTSGQTLLSMTISSEIGRHLTSALVHATPTIDIGGLLAVINNSGLQPVDQLEKIPLDQLVADAVSQEMLEDEPEAAHMLSEFRVRLLKSLEHVDKAIASLPKT